jgi:hypothetical protein
MDLFDFLKKSDGTMVPYTIAVAFSTLVRIRGDIRNGKSTRRYQQ